MTLEIGRTPAASIPDRMHSITETAALAGTSVRALRYYEDLGLLLPLRNVRRARVYPPALVATVCRIADMRRLGISVPAIAASLLGVEQSRPDVIVEVLLQRLQVIEGQKHALTTLLSQVRDGRSDVSVLPSNDVDQHKGSSRSTRPSASSAMG